MSVSPVQRPVAYAPYQQRLVVPESTTYHYHYHHIGTPDVGYGCGSTPLDEVQLQGADIDYYRNRDYARDDAFYHTGDGVYRSTDGIDHSGGNRGGAQLFSDRGGAQLFSAEHTYSRPRRIKPFPELAPRSVPRFTDARFVGAVTYRDSGAPSRARHSFSDSRQRQDVSNRPSTARQRHSLQGSQRSQYEHASIPPPDSNPNTNPFVNARGPRWKGGFGGPFVRVHTGDLLAERRKMNQKRGARFQ